MLIKDVPQLFLTNISPLIKVTSKLQSHYRNAFLDPLGTGCKAQLGTTDLYPLWYAVVTLFKIMGDPIIQLWIGRGRLVTYATAEDLIDMTSTVITILKVA